MSERSTRRGRWTDWIEPDPLPEPQADAEPLDDGTGRPRDPWTHLEPLFPVTSFTPHSRCPHQCATCGGSGRIAAAKGASVPCVDCNGTGVGPIPEGSDFVCMVCHAAGKDGTPALPRGVKPLPPEYAPPPGDESKTLNRKERRKRARAQRNAVTS